MFKFVECLLVFVLLVCRPPCLLCTLNPVRICQFSIHLTQKILKRYSEFVLIVCGCLAFFVNFFALSFLFPCWFHCSFSFVAL